MRQRTDWEAYLKSLVPAAVLAVAAFNVAALVFGYFL